MQEQSYKVIEQEKEKMDCWCIIDIDGVLNYYPKCWLDFVYDRTYKIYSSLQEAKRGMSYYEYKRIKSLYRTTGFKATIPVRDGAANFLDELRMAGYKVALVTARDFNLSYEDTVKWLQTNNLHYDKLIFDGKKHSRAFETFPYAAFAVDDNTYIAGLFAKFGIKTFLVDGPDNQQYQELSGASRVKLLSEILSQVIPCKKQK